MKNGPEKFYSKTRHGRGRNGKRNTIETQTDALPKKSVIKCNLGGKLGESDLTA